MASGTVSMRRLTTVLQLISMPPSGKQLIYGVRLAGGQIVKRAKHTGIMMHAGICGEIGLALLPTGQYLLSHYTGAQLAFQQIYFGRTVTNIMFALSCKFFAYNHHRIKRLRTMQCKIDLVAYVPINTVLPRQNVTTRHNIVCLQQIFDSMTLSYMNVWIISVEETFDALAKGILATAI